MKNSNNLTTIISAALFALALPQPVLADAQSGVAALENGDVSAAVDTWRTAAQAGDADAQFNLAQAYRLGRGVPQDLTEAENWYRRAAVQGHLRAEDNLGLILFQKRAYPQAFPLLEKSAARGDARAQYVLGTALFNGDLIKRDWTRAYALMLRSSANGLGRATDQLHEMNKYVQPYVKEQAQILAEKLAVQEAPKAESFPPAPVVVEEQAAPRPTDAQPSPAPMPVESASAPAPQPLPEPPAAKTTAHRTSAPLALKKGWYVQLGAFAEKANAATFLRTGKSRLPGLSPYRLTSRPHGRLTAVLAGPIANRTQAEQVCNAVRKQGQACLIVAP
ncbi:MAG: SEL1-like repeat protein [Alphaproteobacteria bacterium]|nr:SEL1-like repeat protein [Alphaproteobacteria bacterium]